MVEFRKDDDCKAAAGFSEIKEEQDAFARGPIVEEYEQERR